MFQSSANRLRAWFAVVDDFLGDPPDDDGSVVGEQVEVSFGTLTVLAPEPVLAERLLMEPLAALPWNCPGGSCHTPSL